MTEILYTVSEVASLIKCNVSYVHKLRKAGLLKFMKLGSYKCRAAELDRFLTDAEGKDLTDLDNIKNLKEQDYEN